MSDDKKRDAAAEEAERLIKALGSLCESMQAAPHMVTIAASWLLMEGLEQLAEKISRDEALRLAHRVKAGMDAFIEGVSWTRREENPAPPGIVVHSLWGGRALCGKWGPVSEWPPGHRWGHELDEITCADCRRREGAP